MTNPGTTRRSPTLIVADADYLRLTDLADVAQDRFPGAADALQKEIDRAHILPTDQVPSNVVRMGSIVEFRSDQGQLRRITLVFPGDADIAKGRVSILTPVGTALIGLSEGQSIAWTARDGRRQELTVTKVEAPR